MSSLENKVALVTGAGKGIGKAIALKLGAEGAKIIVTDFNDEQGKTTTEQIKKEGGNAIYYHLDISKSDYIERAIEKIIESEGAIELAINNAGIGGKLSPIHEMKLVDWNNTMNVNLTGLFLCMKSEPKSMLANGGGRIVNISSLAGINGVPGGGHYCASKHGVIGLTKTAALEYGQYNVRVNAVCPGFIETDILKQVPENILELSKNIRVPMKRIGQPEEVANTVFWLLSDGSSYVNGHSLYLGGGFMAG